jgi:single stranded DNA-binding protein
MQTNKVQLRGFLAGDAVVRTNKNKNQFTTLRLGTARSYRNKETGKWENEPTQWHNLTMFGRLGEQAAKLKGGEYIEVEGELRYSKYKGVQTATIRVYLLLKLLRSPNAESDEFDEIAIGIETF